MVDPLVKTVKAEATQAHVRTQQAVYKALFMLPHTAISIPFSKITTSCKTDDVHVRRIPCERDRQCLHTTKSIDFIPP